MEYFKLCLNCNKSFIIIARHSKSNRKKYCSRPCLYEHMHKTRTQGIVEYSCKTCGILFKGRKVRKRTFCSNKCWSNGNIGSRLSSEHKKIISETRKKDWENGIYNKIESFRTKWYNHYNNENELIRCQGQWEKQYAEWLDFNKIEYSAHKKSFRYFDDNNKERIYFPDFYLVKEDLHIDVKSSYINSISKNKFSNVLRCNKINLKFLLEIDLLELGIIPIGITKNRMLIIANKFYKNNVDFLMRIEKYFSCQQTLK